MKPFNMKWFQNGLALIIILLSVCTNSNGHYHESSTSSSTTITVPLSYLLQPAHDDPCKPSPQGRRQGGASLEVRHKYGPCSPLKSPKLKRPTYKEMVEHDEARIESIKNRVNPKKVVDLYGVRLEKQVNLPVESGSTIGSPNFIVTIGLGTPRKDLTLEFDTGSDLTWTQCEPCVGKCYEQQEPKFNPTKSSTYSNITCNSPLCSELKSAGAATGCISSTCIYGVEYKDSSFTVGFFAKDTLYLGMGPQDVVPNFLFGCGENNQGLFNGAAGLLGLGRNKLSVVSQTASSYGNIFSYCLPFRSSSTGHLTFGKPATGAGAMMQYTPLVQANTSFYFIDLLGITVGDQKLAISPSVFSAGGTIIDSGTIISRLPPAAYSALQEAFTKAMSTLYPKAAASGPFDTCFTISGSTTNITVPKVSLLFGGGAHLDLPISGKLIGTDDNQVCLAFIGNDNAGDTGVLGNLQQLTFDIVYDIAGGRLGFGPGGCA